MENNLRQFPNPNFQCQIKSKIQMTKFFKFRAWDFIGNWDFDI